MYKLFFIVFANILLSSTLACKKNNSSQGSGEAQLIISTDALPYSEITGSSTGFNLTVESAMPPAGVRIQAIAKGETDNVNYFTGSIIETSAKTSNLTISNLPRQKICIVTVYVISISKSANFATTIFRIVSK